MSKPNERDREVSERITGYMGLVPRTAVLAEYRAEIEAAARADERSKLAAQLDAWRMSCPTYFAKALWRELDKQIVALGGESRDYWVHCTEKGGGNGNS